MIEEVQDTLVSILTDNLSSELSSLASPSGGVAMTLDVPARYLLDYTPQNNQPILSGDLFPCCVVYYEDSDVDDEISTGYRVVWWHRFTVVLLFLTTELKDYTDALNAIENLQRGRSRYAEAITAALKKNQQTSPIQMISFEGISRGPTLVKADMTQIFGSVGIGIRVREAQTL